jgi:protease-4
MRNDRRMPEPMRRVLRARVERTYLDFLERVSEARGLPLDTVRTLAEGRVWSGEQALDVGLVDELGGREDAVARAAELAGLEEGGYKTRDVEPPTSWRDELLVELVSRSGRVVGPVFARRTPVWLESVASRLDDPTGVYALSFIPLDGDGSAE